MQHTLLALVSVDRHTIAVEDGGTIAPELGGGRGMEEPGVLVSELTHLERVALLPVDGEGLICSRELHLDQVAEQALAGGALPGDPEGRAQCGSWRSPGGPPALPGPFLPLSLYLFQRADQALYRPASWFYGLAQTSATKLRYWAAKA